MLALETGQQRTNMSSLTPGMRAHVRPNTEELVERLYADDVEKFERLALWSPDPNQVRLMSGYCATCAAKRGEQHLDIEPGDDDEDGDAPPDEFVPTFASTQARDLFDESDLTEADLESATGRGKDGTFTSQDIKKLTR